MIICEGADGAGKTLLAQRIATATGWPLQHSGGPPKTEEEMCARVFNYLHGSKRIVFDRFPVISDVVYASVMGRTTPVRPEMRTMLDACQPLIIFCHAPDDVIRGSQDTPGIDTAAHVGLVIKHHRRLRQAYFEYFDRYPPSIIHTWFPPDTDRVMVRCGIHTRLIEQGGVS